MDLEISEGTELNLERFGEEESEVVQKPPDSQEVVDAVAN